MTSPCSSAASRPIPEVRGLVGWEAVPTWECGEPLVALSTYAPGRIVVDARYHAAGYAAALPECYARATMARRLAEAAATLPAGWRLVVFDAWRPLAVQQQLFEGYVAALRAAQPGASEATLRAAARRYVALPSGDPARPSPHATGGVVDLSVADATGTLLDMGTAFDAFDARSATRYYERLAEAGQQLTARERRYLENRRVLFHALAGVGFTSHPEEWWHFEYGRSQYGPLLGLEDWRVLGRGQPYP
jgi:D-alanyl-D-alanine dipeptidase